ncbi:MAG: AsmA family protein, partial [Burkholderiales bacterium]|nr:AsmA family protein [Burkholderiales bacterium]
MAGLVAALLAVLVAAFAAGAVLDLSRWRDAVAQHASAAVGRPVLLQGALQLKLGRELVLRIGDVRLPSPPGFDAPSLLSVAEATLRIDLLDALRGRARLRGIEARDIGLWLERAADGRANWSAAPTREPDGAPTAIDLGPIGLRRVAIHVKDVPSGTHRRFELDSLHGHAAPDKALRLALRGWGDDGSPYRLQVEGGTLRQLLDGAGAWLFKLDFHAAQVWLQAGGAWHASRGEARFEVDAQADDLAQAGRPWGLALPAAVAASLRGGVVATAQAVDLDVAEGRLAGATIAGGLRLDLAGARPRLHGHLHVDEFDLRPWFAADAAPPSADLDELLRQPVPRFDGLPLDVALGLQVQRWAGLPAELRDLSLELQADPRRLRVPLRATLAGAALSGRLELDTSAAAPRLALQLAAVDLEIGGTAAGRADGSGLDGRLGRAELRLDGRGDTWGALVQDLELALVGSGLRLQQGSAGAARPVVVALDRVALAAGRGEALRGSASGTLDGERAGLALRGATLRDLLRDRALPLEAELTTAPATLRIATVIAPGATRDLDLTFALQARRAGDLARWLPVSPQSDLPLALRARWRSGDDAKEPADDVDQHDQDAGHGVAA